MRNTERPIKHGRLEESSEFNVQKMGLIAKEKKECEMCSREGFTPSKGVAAKIGGRESTPKVRRADSTASQ